MRFRWYLVFAVFFTVGSAGACAQTRLRFTATIHAGERYTHSIGHGLYFALDQVDGGDWNFQIRPSPDSHESYTDCLGSPFLHGPSNSDLVAWRFAPGADAGWAEHVPVTKLFSFVTSATDEKYECAESSATYDSFQRSQTKGLDPDYGGLPHYKPRLRAKGRVNLSAVILKPGLSGADAEFSQVTLAVTIEFPHRHR